jgi:hypothetical protein
MRGHEQIIALRLRRKAPKTVQIWCGTDALQGWRDWHTSTGHAEVEIQDGDALSGLDLRFTVGMLVMVNGTDPFRVAAVHAGCLAAGAQRVVSAAVYFDPQRPNADGVVGRVLDSAAEAVCTF